MAENPERASYPDPSEIWRCPECDTIVQAFRDCPCCGPCKDCKEEPCGCDRLADDRVDWWGD